MANNSYGLNYKNLLEYDVNVEDLCLKINADVGVLKFDEVYKTTIPNFRSERLHHHDTYELFFNLTEKLHGYFGDGENVLFDESMLIIVPPEYKHRFFEKSWVNSLSFKFSMSKAASKSKLKIYEKFSRICTAPYMAVKCDEKMVESLLLLKKAIINRNPMLVSARMYETIAHVLGSSEQMLNSHSALTPDSNQSRTHKVHTMIENYYAPDISLNDIADSLNISNRQLIRIVKQHYGCTFREQITRLRMDTAYHLLSETDMSITEISTRIGYNSSNSFSQVFKKFFGVSPSEFRKKTQK